MVELRRGTGRAILALGFTLSLLAPACSSSGDATPQTTVEVTTTTIQPPPQGDGRLVLGVLLPTSESLIGVPMVDAVELAVQRINSSGGVLGRSVRVVIADEGSTAATAAAGIQTLLDDDVDAIVGPASSVIALNVLGQIVSAGVLSCSPTASALALDDFPDDELFFRTVPSDSLQAEGIADVADLTGAQRASIVYVDDAYGRPFAEATQAALDSRPISVVDMIPFTGRDDNLSDEAAKLVGSDAQVAVVLADGDDGTRFLEALGDVDSSSLATVIVNDAMRSPASPQRIEALDTTLRNKIIGVAPQAESEKPKKPFDPPGLYAANAYDCVNLIALSAAKVGSDAPRDIAGQMASVSASGSVCREYATCKESLDAGLQIDYNGPSGVTELIVRRGDPSRAVFDQFAFDDTGRDTELRTFVVGN